MAGMLRYTPGWPWAAQRKGALISDHLYAAHAGSRNKTGQRPRRKQNCQVFPKVLGVSAFQASSLLSVYYLISLVFFDFPGGSVIKNVLAMQEMKFPFLVREDALEKEIATHSSILA